MLSTDFYTENDAIKNGSQDIIVCDRCLEWLLKLRKNLTVFIARINSSNYKITIPLQNISLYILYTYTVQCIRTAATFPRHNFK